MRKYDTICDNHVSCGGDFMKRTADEFHNPGFLISVSTVLCNARKKKGISQIGLAKKCGMSRQSISAIESTGITNITIDTLLTICDALDILPENVIYTARLLSEEEEGPFTSLSETC